MTVMHSLAKGIAAVSCCLLASSGVVAQTSSGRPLQVIVGGTAGGIDGPIRAMAPELSRKLGQTVVVDNRPGANGLIAAQAVARAEHDGNTLLYTTVSTLVLAPLLQKQASETTKSLVPVASVYESFQVLAVSPRVTAKSVSELIAYAKANPGKLNYVSSGNGSLFHLIGELFTKRAGVDIVHVPQKSLPPAVQDLVGGHVDLGFLSYNAIRPHAASGKLRILAVMAPQRLPGAPDIPAINETLPDFPRIPSWIGIAAPVGTPPARLAQLHQAIVESLEGKEVRDLIEREGNVPGGKNGEELAREIKRDTDLVAGIIKSAGIEPE